MRHHVDARDVADVLILTAEYRMQLMKYRVRGRWDPCTLSEFQKEAAGLIEPIVKRETPAFSKCRVLIELACEASTEAPDDGSIAKIFEWINSALVSAVQYYVERRADIDRSSNDVIKLERTEVEKTAKYVLEAFERIKEAGT